MKNATFFVSILTFSIAAMALAKGRPGPGLTPVKLSDVIAQVERTNLTPRGHALLFGSDTIESCVYTGEDLVVLVHYCFPKKPYPARAISFWSKKFGVVEMYEEDLSAVRIIKRDIRQNEFPELVDNIFSLDFPHIDFDTINSVSKKLYDRPNPACWATTYDPNTQKANAACYLTDIKLFPAWAKDSSRVAGSKEWEDAYARVKKKLNF